MSVQVLQEGDARMKFSSPWEVCDTEREEGAGGAGDPFWEEGEKEGGWRGRASGESTAGRKSQPGQLPSRGSHPWEGPAQIWTPAVLSPWLQQPAQGRGSEPLQWAPTEGCWPLTLHILTNGSEFLHLTENDHTCALYNSTLRLLLYVLNAGFLKTSRKPVFHAVYIACP